MLNIPLYNALCRAFGDVRVANENEQAIFKAPQSSAVLSQLGRRPRPERLYGGEQYHVCCPFCGDKRHRLYISHTWGKYVLSASGDVFSPSKRAICHNEDCLNKPGNFRDLEARIASRLDAWDEVPLACSVEQPVQRTMAFPAGWRLDSPAADAAVRQYVVSRGFSPVELGVGWQAHSCQIDFYPRPCLVFPIFQWGVLRGWQARYAGEDHDKIGRPKYYNPPGMKKSWLLYNADRARFYSVVVLVEGVFDAARVGECAVALFGKQPSPYQEMMLASYWKNGALVWLPDVNDPTAAPIAQEFVDKWNASCIFAGGAWVVKLPAGDPGGTPRREIWERIKEASRSR